MATIYLVKRASGYCPEDFHDEVVRAWTSKELAEKHIEEGNRLIAEEAKLLEDIQHHMREYVKRFPYPLGGTREEIDKHMKCWIAERDRYMTDILKLEPEQREYLAFKGTPRDGERFYIEECEINTEYDPEWRLTHWGA